MEIVLTGTGSPIPDANRAGPSTLVKAGDTHVLVDAGRGVVMRMAGAGSLPMLLSAVLVTHLHSDHICDLNDVITTHWVMSQGNATLAVYAGRPTGQQIPPEQLTLPHTAAAATGHAMVAAMLFALAMVFYFWRKIV